MRDSGSDFAKLSQFWLEKDPWTIDKNPDLCYITQSTKRVVFY